MSSFRSDVLQERLEWALLTEDRPSPRFDDLPPKSEEVHSWDDDLDPMPDWDETAAGIRHPSTKCFLVLNREK